MRLTRFQWILVGTALAALLIVVLCRGATCLVLLSLLFSLAGLWIGLGVSFPQRQMFGPSLCRVRTGEKVVALTFDDGPDPETTPALLTLLAQRGVRATFFCVGDRVARHPEVARRIAAEGHLVENHSHRHSPWTNLFSVRRLREDVSRAQAEIERATGRAPQFFRPPMGLTNQRVFRVVKELGLGVAGYSARGRDQRTGSAERVVARILRRVRPGTIVLLHDGGVPARRLLAGVTMLIDKLEAAGYQCRRLDELISCEAQR
jgi:peptidoglycan/xylan/chitin deacetylase (PgdA/CDA1 family)